MGQIDAALQKGDQLLKELTGDQGRPRPSTADSMGQLKKVAYTHEAMIELIIEGSSKPGGIAQKEIAQHFGYTESWISNILASEAFQARLAQRREEIIDPRIRASIKERFEALTIQSLKILQEKLSQNVVNDQVALRCAELGAKALGVGGHAPPPPSNNGQDRLARLAERLVMLHAGVKERVVNGEVQLLSAPPQPPDE